MYELYALLEPNNSKIKYIGYTSKPERRLTDHLYACLNLREKNCYRCKWLNKLRLENKKPIYKTLLRTDCLDCIKEAEIDYINYYSNLYKLTNNTKGGDGVTGLKWSEESKNKIKGRKIPGDRNKPKKLLITNSKTKEELIVSKEEAVKIIGCSISTIRGHHNRPVYGWHIKTYN